MTHICLTIFFLMTTALRAQPGQTEFVPVTEFLFGTEPCVADLCTYHSLWFMRTQVPRFRLQDRPAFFPFKFLYLVEPALRDRL